MKKLAALILTLALLLAALTAFAERDLPASDDPVALTVNRHEFTRSELEAAVTLHLFEAALQCAGYGYGYDIMDRGNIENSMDLVLFDLEMYSLVRDLGEEMGVYPLNEAAAAAAEEEAEKIWSDYIDIAYSDNGMAFLPAGDYEYIENDPEGNLTRYFASFGLTKDAVLRREILRQTDQEIQKIITAFMEGKTEDEIIDYYTDWFVAKMDEDDVTQRDEVIAEAIENLAEGSSDHTDGGYEAYERSILIRDCWYTLGESTLRDFERNGWEWKQETDGTFAIQVTEEGNNLYVRTDNNQPDGKLVMVDLFYAYEIAYEYLGISFDLAFNPESKDILDYLTETYGGDFTDEGVFQARTEVTGGTLLIEVGEYALRLTLE